MKQVVADAFRFFGQIELVRTLELGLVTKCAVLCVSSLTLCTMEMQAVMKR